MLLNSGKEWAELGFQCDVLATSAEVGPLAGQMEEHGYGVFHIPFKSRLRLLPRISFVSRFSSLCRSGYDVVHIHTEAGPPVLALLAKLAGVRRIAVTPHSFFRFTGILRIRKALERLFVRLLGGRYGMISKGVQQCEWERFRNRGVRIRNWLDTCHFRPPTPTERAEARLAINVAENDFVIVSVGNCCEVKNHPSALRAIKMIPDSFRPIYIHIGREDAGHSERTLAAELNIEDRVQFMDSQVDVRPFLWAADVFLMPSFREGFSISAIEAIASGTMMVCSDAEGLIDLASETRFTVVASITPQSLAAGIAKAAELDPVERSARAIADSERIRSRFSVGSGVRSIVSGLYDGNPAEERAAAKRWGHA